MFKWPEDRKIQPGLSSNDAHKLAVKMLNGTDDESMARKAEADKHYQKTLKSKEAKGLIGPVVPAAGITAYSGTEVVKGVKGATFGDLELDSWLSELLAPLPNKLCTIYTGALADATNGLNCFTMEDLTTGKCCPGIDSDEKLVSIGFKPGHARRLFAKLQVLREEQTLIIAEREANEQASKNIIEAATSGSTVTKAGPRGRRGVMLSTNTLPSAPSNGMFSGLSKMFGNLPPTAIDELGGLSDSDSSQDSTSGAEAE